MSSSGDKKAELLVDSREGEGADDQPLQEGKDMGARTEIMTGGVLIFKL